MTERWNEDEIDFLRENVGVLRVPAIAKRLNRPIEGVFLKMKRLKIANTKKQTGLLTMGELANLLQVNRKTIENWHYRHELPVIKKKTKDIKVFYLIEQEEFWEWAYNHQNRIDFAKIEKHSIPPEPEWVEPLRHVKREIKGNYYRQWTTGEVKQLLELRKEGVSFKEIGIQINRTTISAERKHTRLTESEENV